jgi:hypothetical protein
LVQRRETSVDMIREEEEEVTAEEAAAEEDTEPKTVMGDTPNVVNVVMMIAAPRLAGMIDTAMPLP